MKGQNFSSQVLSRHTFRILRKKGSDFFDHRGTLNGAWGETFKLLLDRFFLFFHKTNKNGRESDLLKKNRNH